MKISQRFYYHISCCLAFNLYFSRLRFQSSDTKLIIKKFKNTGTKIHVFISQFFKLHNFTYDLLVNILNSYPIFKCQIFV